MIDGECKKNAVLRSRLEPWVKKMEGKPGDLKLAQEFIDEFEKLKKEINDGIRSEDDQTSRVSQIKSINER